MHGCIRIISLIHMQGCWDDWRMISVSEMWHLRNRKDHFDRIENALSFENKSETENRNFQCLAKIHCFTDKLPMNREHMK